ncbi:MAG: M16 family metallopeptidase, partial [Brevefilum sp.]
GHRQTLPGPDDITRKELPNGIIVLSRPNFNSPTLSIKGYIHSGSYFDPDDKLGLGYLTAHGLMNGTLNYDFQSLYNEIESVGARLSFSAGTLTTSFSAHCLSEDLSLMLSLIAESLRSPTFPEKEFNRQKTQLLTGLAIRDQDTAAMAALLFDQIVYAGHPYQRPDEGYPETVRSINREDLINFYQQTYGPRKMVVVVVGAVEPEEAVDAVRETLGDWHNLNQRSLPEIPSAQPMQKTTQKTLSIPGKAQADIVMGSLAPERLSPDYYPLRIGNNILGEFGMMGRLGQKVREEAGLAYYAYSSLSLSRGPGAWEMIAGVNPENVEKAVTLITEEVKRFVTEPVSEDELADTKSYFLGRMPLLLESNSGVAISLMNMEHFHLGLNYFREYPKQVQAVNAEDILHASQKYLGPDRLGVAVAGP